MRIESFTDWARALNSILAFFTAIFMWTVTWRLAPKMRWYELSARQGITAVFIGVIYRNIEILSDRTHESYGLGVFIYTLGLTVTTIAFYVWASRLPARQWQWSARVRLRWKTHRQHRKDRRAP